MSRRVRDLGGGIEKENVGSSTATYEGYFEQHDSANRKANYTDVVNKCVAACTRSFGKANRSGAFWRTPAPRLS